MSHRSTNLSSPAQSTVFSSIGHHPTQPTSSRISLFTAGIFCLIAGMLVMAASNQTFGRCVFSQNAAMSRGLGISMLSIGTLVTLFSLGSCKKRSRSDLTLLEERDRSRATKTWAEEQKKLLSHELSIEDIIFWFNWFIEDIQAIAHLEIDHTYLEQAQGEEKAREDFQRKMSRRYQDMDGADNRVVWMALPNSYDSTRFASYLLHNIQLLFQKNNDEIAKLIQTNQWIIVRILAYRYPNQSNSMEVFSQGSCFQPLQTLWEAETIAHSTEDF